MKNFKTFFNVALIATSLFLTNCNRDDDENPEQISVQDLVVTIDENPSNGQVIDTVQVDGSENENLSFSITSQTPAGALNINTSTGVLTVADASLFDFETNPVIIANISVTNTVNTGTVTINLNDVAELNVADLTIDFDENPSNGQVVDIVPTTNESGALSFSITSQTPVGALSIDPSTGTLTVADTALFDFETNPVITANISVVDGINTATAVATINLNDLNEIGEFNYGGVVFWVDPTNNNTGLVCAVSDQSPGAPYGCMHTVTGATGVDIGTGAANTVAIESVCTTAGTAADLAANLSMNGYDDWFLPSQNELNEIMINITLVNATIIANGGTSVFGSYWTSTEIDGASARKYNPTNDWFPADYKSLLRPVRSVRAF